MFERLGAIIGSDKYIIFIFVISLGLGGIMAIYKLNSEKARNRTSKARKITGFTMIGVSSVVFLFMTGIVPVLQKFLLGIFGVFGFVLCILMILIGLAVLNKRKYVMSKRYAICLILATICFIALIQLMIVGNKFDGDGTKLSFWQYWALNYSKTWTAGGFLIGFLTTCTMYITNLVGSYLIFGLGLAVTIALLVDSLNRLKAQKVVETPVAVQIKETEEDISPALPKETIKKENEEINVVLDGKLKEEQNAHPTAKQMLGLDHKRNYAYEYQSQNSDVLKRAATTVVKQEPPKPKNLKEYILTPPEVDIDEYFKNIRTRSTTPAKEEVDQNVAKLKHEEEEHAPETQNVNQTQNIVVTPPPTYNEVKQNVVEEVEEPEENQQEPENDVFVPENNQFARPLEEIDSTEFVEQADDILRSVIEEEKENNQESYVQTQQTAQTNDDENRIDERSSFERREENPEANLLNRLPERNNSGVFERRSFDRSDRMMSQEDKDARNEFNRDFDRISMRNGSLVRENDPIPEEEPEEPIVPYNYDKPPIDLITTESVDPATLNTDVEEKRVALENALDTFGVPAKVQNVVIGPAVTRYELEMPQGVSISKIKQHQDDIAYTLAAPGAIRLEAPVPGKSVVGVEVPNTAVATVSLKDILMSREFQDAKAPLTVAIGKDIAGNIICANLQKLTHLLVAGTTNSGKSVCLNSIILSLMFRLSPEDVRFILIDPKSVEFTNYEGMPHLIMPKVVTDAQKASNALGWAVEEMERRFKMLQLARVKDIGEYNQTPDVLQGKVRKMPFIIIIADELADLMMTGRKEVEDKIIRLAQKARAAGIHLILATQRPSVDIITGLIKANMPSRLSCAVQSPIESQVILARTGAEKLLGRGDMLYMPIGANEPIRVQGCFLTTPEINAIVDYVRDNNEPIFDKEVENRINNPNANVGQDENRMDEIDPLFKQALKLGIELGKISGTDLRRRFAVGYSRAARLIDQLEAAGHISTQDGTKPRTVYMTEEEFRDLYGDEEWDR